MKKVTKVIAIMMAIMVMVLGMCSCGRNDHGTAVSTNGQTTVTETAQQTDDKGEKEEDAKKAEAE